MIGTCLYSTRLLTEATQTLVPTDFYTVKWQMAFEAITRLHAEGQAVTAISVQDCLQTLGYNSLTWVELDSCRSEAPSTLTTHMGIVLRHSTARQVLRLGAEAAHALHNHQDPVEAMVKIRAGIDEALRARGPAVDIFDLDQACDDETSEAPWAVEDMLRTDERMVVVGSEGAGKSTLLRQWAICMSQGIHPLTFRRIEPQRVLIWDAENSSTTFKEQARPMRGLVRRYAGGAYDPKRFHVVRQLGGAEMRGSKGLHTVEQSLDAFRPAVVFAGPLYKLSHRDKNEGHDDFASEMQYLLDKLRTFYGFALVIEDHAPQGDHGVRAMRPFGSSMWLRWPEFGLGLKSSDRNGSLEVSTFRGNRLHRIWPTEFVRGGEWPWEARFPTGTFQKLEQPEEDDPAF